MTFSLNIDNVQFKIFKIFILIGLLDVWTPKETMIKLMGEGSGFMGILIKKDEVNAIYKKAGDF